MYENAVVLKCLPFLLATFSRTRYTSMSTDTLKRYAYASKSVSFNFCAELEKKDLANRYSYCQIQIIALGQSEAASQAYDEIS